jgi:hypothetical protein
MDHQYQRREQQDLSYSAARFNEKGCFGVEMLFVLTHHKTRISHIMLQSRGGNYVV